jgi:hypothetical protein
MRRLRALVLFTLGYMLMALFSPLVATVPALAVFGLASLILLRAPRLEPEDASEAVARELLGRR